MKVFCVISVLLIACANRTTTAEDEEVDCKNHPEPVDPKTCCPIPDMLTPEIEEKCKQYDQPPPPMDGPNDIPMDESRPRPHPHPRPHPRPHPHPHPCFFSCVVNETGIMDSNRKLNEPALNKYLGEMLAATPDLLPVMQEAFKTCAAKGEEFRAKMEEHWKNKTMPSPPPGHRPMCQPGGGMLVGCAFIETFNNCPASIWTNTDECNNWRTYMQACKRGRGGHGRGRPHF